MRSKVIFLVYAALQAGCQSSSQSAELAENRMCYGIPIPVESYLPDSIARESLCASVVSAIAAVVNPQLGDSSFRMQAEDSIERIIAFVAPVEIEAADTHTASSREVLQVGIALDAGPVLEVRLDLVSLRVLHIGKGDRGAMEPE